MPLVRPRVILVVDYDNKATAANPLPYDHASALEPFTYELRRGPGVVDPTYANSAEGRALVDDPEGTFDAANISASARKRITGAFPAFIYVLDKALPDYTLRWAGISVLGSRQRDTAVFQLYGTDYFLIQQERLFPRFNTDEPYEIDTTPPAIGMSGLIVSFNSDCSGSVVVTVDQDTVDESATVVFAAGIEGSGRVSRIGTAPANNAVFAFGPTIIQPGVPYRWIATTNFGGRIERVYTCPALPETPGTGGGGTSTTPTPPDDDDDEPMQETPVDETPMQPEPPVTPPDTPAPTVQPNVQVDTLAFIVGTTSAVIGGTIKDLNNKNGTINNVTITLQLKLSTASSWGTAFTATTNAQGNFATTRSSLQRGATYDVRARVPNGVWKEEEFTTPPRDETPPVVRTPVVATLVAGTPTPTSITLVATHQAGGFGASTRTYGRYRKKGATTWISLATQTPDRRTRISSWTLTGLDADTDYEAQASHVNTFNPNAPAVFRTAKAPVQHRVTAIRISRTHNTASLLATTDAPVGATIRLVYARRGTRTSTTLTGTVVRRQDGLRVANFSLTRLRASSTYDIGARVVGSTAAQYRGSFTTAAAPAGPITLSLSAIALPNISRLSAIANVTVTATQSSRNVAVPSGTRVYWRWAKSNSTFTLRSRWFSGGSAVPGIDKRASASLAPLEPISYYIVEAALDANFTKSKVRRTFRSGRIKQSEIDTVKDLRDAEIESRNALNALRVALGSQAIEVASLLRVMEQIDDAASSQAAFTNLRGDFNTLSKRVTDEAPNIETLVDAYKAKVEAASAAAGVAGGVAALGAAVAGVYGAAVGAVALTSGTILFGSAGPIIAAITNATLVSTLSGALILAIGPILALVGAFISNKWQNDIRKQIPRTEAYLEALEEARDKATEAVAQANRAVAYNTNLVKQLEAELKAP